jgi:predicted O-linked N-acetylglucosamine transferase (SPINDLY family)
MSKNPRKRKAPKKASAKPAKPKSSTSLIDSMFSRAMGLHQSGKISEAHPLYEEILALQPNHFDALHLLGVIYIQLKNPHRAVELIGAAIDINPKHPSAHSNLGKALHDLKHYRASCESCDRAIVLKADYAEAHNNRGNALRGMKEYQLALESYDKALALNPGCAEAYNNRGVALRELKEPKAALDHFDKAISLKPDYADAHFNRSLALHEAQRYEAAIGNCDDALILKAGYALIDCVRLDAKLHICDWRDLAVATANLALDLQSRKLASAPLSTLAFSGSLSVQKLSSEIWAGEYHPAVFSVADLTKLPPHEKIRIGYYSADFREHATAYLIAEMFERHDRGRFELIAFSFGPDEQDPMRQRLVAAFDRFIDVRSRSDREVALLSRELEVDIAVDLKGHTQNSRMGIFAERAAPVQVSYLGYPGTSGAQYIDYLIADPVLIPTSSQSFYSEKIVYLPNSYQVNDRKRQISDKPITRSDCRLPEEGFVFCCFNNNYKILPEVFDVWMRLLQRVEGSVLWLLEDNPTAASNLRKEAVRRGVSEARLIFAPRLPLPEHLARHRLADLFLDTLPCNAHTTASDALWAGLPVLTCVGEAFASRVAASLLTAIGLPELITESLDAYEALALEIAFKPEKLADLKQTLAANRLTTPLFDTELFTKHIEAAYTAMYERYQEDLMPEHVSVLVV